MESTSPGYRTRAEGSDHRDSPLGQPAAIAGVIRRPARDSEAVESTALLIASGLFVVASVIAAILFWGQFSPISGPGN
jgi:hypothetical protein